MGQQITTIKIQSPGQKKIKQKLKDLIQWNVQPLSLSKQLGGPGCIQSKITTFYLSHTYL